MDTHHSILQSLIHLEQGIFSARMADLKAGLVMAIQLLELFHSRQYGDRATLFAAEYSGFDPQRQIAGMMARIEQLLQS